MFPGKKMAGHLGNERVTTLNLEVVATDEARGLIMVRGAVPGSKGGYVLLRDAVKRPLPEGVPFPAGLHEGWRSGRGRRSRKKLRLPRRPRRPPTKGRNDRDEVRRHQS